MADNLMGHSTVAGETHCGADMFKDTMMAGLDDATDKCLGTYGCYLVLGLVAGAPGGFDALEYGLGIFHCQYFKGRTDDFHMNLYCVTVVT